MLENPENLICISYQYLCSLNFYQEGKVYQYFTYDNKHVPRKYFEIPTNFGEMPVSDFWPPKKNKNSFRQSCYPIQNSEQRCIKGITVVAMLGTDCCGLEETRSTQQIFSITQSKDDGNSKLLIVGKSDKILHIFLRV